MKISIGLGASLAALCLSACAAPGTVKPAGANVAQDQPCTVQSGSRLAQNDPPTTAGRCYTYEDMRRTGATQAGEALTLLDPSITIHR
jgi:hypothetical protein